MVWPDERNLFRGMVTIFLCSPLFLFRIDPSSERDKPWRPSWISGRNNFSSCESPCRLDASHEVSTQTDLRFGRRCEEFQDGRHSSHGGHPGHRYGTILAILNLMSPNSSIPMSTMAATPDRMSQTSPL